MDYIRSHKGTGAGSGLPRVCGISALDRAFSKNEALGDFSSTAKLAPLIKRLRLERLSGKYLGNMLTRLTNLQELFLLIHIVQADNITGLLLALPELRPTRLTLQNTEYEHVYRNRNAEKVVAAIVDCLKNKWDGLVRR